ncbi:TPA: UDP-N-acetylglucosamine 2-epimerase (hydrolyzing), partial [Vibrio harveyi]
ATKESISNAVSLAVSRKYKAENENIANPYGQGDSSKQVIEMIKGLQFERSKAFYDLTFDNV